MATYLVNAVLRDLKLPSGDGVAFVAEPGLGSMAPKITADLVIAHGFSAAVSPEHPYCHTSVIYSGAV